MFPFSPQMWIFNHIFCFVFTDNNNNNNDSGDDVTTDVVLDSLLVNLPNQIRIETSSIPGQNFGIFSKAWVKQGTKMGPYTGKLIPLENREQIDDSSYMWEVCKQMLEMNAEVHL